MLKELRKEMGLTQAEAAKQIGISLSMLQKMEYGQRIPGVKIGIKFAKFYKKPVSVLFSCPESTRACGKNVREE